MGVGKPADKRVFTLSTELDNNHPTSLTYVAPITTDLL
jgi:hypothetical protein